MTTALCVFLSMSLLGSLIAMLATAANREYSTGLKAVIIMLKLGWMAFAIVLLCQLCSH